MPSDQRSSVIMFSSCLVTEILLKIRLLYETMDIIKYIQSYERRLFCITLFIFLPIRRMFIAVPEISLQTSSDKAYLWKPLEDLWEKLPIRMKYVKAHHGHFNCAYFLRALGNVKWHYLKMLIRSNDNTTTSAMYISSNGLSFELFDDKSTIWRLSMKM